MSETAQPPPLPPPGAPKAMENQSPGHPSFFKVMRGVWLFTWRSQLTWQRLPMTLLNLLALPVLIYITTLSPASYARFFPWVPNPVVHLENFENRLGGSESRLKPEQSAELLRAFAEEYARGEKDRSGQQAVKDAYVKVSDGTRIIGAGYTDVRGIFEVGLGGAPGQLSIVAEHGDDVALIRE